MDGREEGGGGGARTCEVLRGGAQLLDRGLEDAHPQDGPPRTPRRKSKHLAHLSDSAGAWLALAPAPKSSRAVQDAGLGGRRGRRGAKRAGEEGRGECLADSRSHVLQRRCSAQHYQIVHLLTALASRFLLPHVSKEISSFCIVQQRKSQGRRKAHLAQRLEVTGAVARGFIRRDLEVQKHRVAHRMVLRVQLRQDPAHRAHAPRSA